MSRLSRLYSNNHYAYYYILRIQHCHTDFFFALYHDNHVDASTLPELFIIVYCLRHFQRHWILSATNHCPLSVYFSQSLERYSLSFRVYLLHLDSIWRLFNFLTCVFNLLALIWEFLSALIVSLTLNSVDIAGKYSSTFRPCLWYIDVTPFLRSSVCPTLQRRSPRYSSYISPIPFPLQHNAL